MHMHQSIVSGVLAESFVGRTVFFDVTWMKLYINGTLENDADVIVRWTDFGFRNMGRCFSGA